MAAVASQSQQQTQTQPQSQSQAQAQTQAQAQAQPPPPPQPQPRERPVSKRELDHLVDIKTDDVSTLTVDRRKQLVFREALVEWKEQVEAFDAKVEKRTKRTEQWTNEIYQLVGLYSVFVGVVFTAVLQSARVQCQHIWGPIVLCVVAFLVLVVVIIKKSKIIDIERATIEEDQAFRKIRVEHIRVLKSEGPSKFDFSHPKFEPAEKKTKIKKGKGQKRNSGASSGLWWILAILTFFTLVLVLSFVHILCINAKTCCSCTSASASASSPPAL